MELASFFTPTIIWFLIGLVLLLLELALPGLIVMFFGVGAWITALCVVIFHPGLNWQLGIFIISSVFLLLLLRRYVKRKFFSENRSNVNSLEEEFIGRTAVAETDLKAGIPGKVSFKGTTWNAITDIDIAAGSQVLIKDKESITLMVTKK